MYDTFLTIDDLDLSALSCGVTGCVEDVFFIGASQEGTVERWCKGHYRNALDGLAQVVALEQDLRQQRIWYIENIVEADHVRIEADEFNGARCSAHGTICPDGFAWQFASLSPALQYGIEGR